MEEDKIAPIVKKIESPKRHIPKEQQKYSLNKDAPFMKNLFDLMDMLNENNEERVSIDRKDLYDLRYKDIGGLEGLKAKREAAGINQEIIADKLKSLGLLNTISYSPINEAMKEEQIHVRSMPLNTEGRHYQGENGKMIDIDKNTWQDQTSTLMHEIMHSYQPSDYSKYKYIKADEDIEGYYNSQQETEARMSQVLHDAMGYGVSPVYDEKTRKEFDDYLKTYMGKKSLEMNKVNEDVVKYLIDKIVSNDTVKNNNLG